MKNWTGLWLMGVGILHTLLGIIFFTDALGGMIADGLWNSVNTVKGRPVAFWFEFVGLVTVLLGAFVYWAERTIGHLPQFLGGGLLALALIAIVAMPMSGGWLLLPPAIAILLRKRRDLGALDQAR